ncbi:hypothetical protein VIAQ111709_18225 [Vibrio aquimaris]|uniref:Uncharacterized protein n=1 Tax=Vibrio aquimaris TaxID=2587862 RepID=A0A5P9CQR3_9VIBR|nr:hypothetical protein FIV01_16560 [Vibrio aquimaris]
MHTLKHFVPSLHLVVFDDVRSMLAIRQSQSSPLSELNNSDIYNLVAIALILWGSVMHWC